MSLATLSARSRLPAIPIILPRARELVCLDPDGELLNIPLAEAPAWLHDRPVMLCNARLVLRRLNLERIHGLDVLELFAFARPAQPCVPTPSGLAQVLSLPCPASDVQACLSIASAGQRLLDLIADDADPTLGPLAASMGQGGWNWSGIVLEALGLGAASFSSDEIRRALRIWLKLPEWQEDAAPSPPGQIAVAPNDARKRLAELVRTTTGSLSEPRPQQADYAGAASFAFVPRDIEGSPQTVLAEAGTGVGKTLGYLAPAIVWAEANAAPVWISTYTRNLQRQIDQSLHRHYGEHSDRVVVRKGRENYICLLNLEEALRSVAMQPVLSVALGLMVRWVSATRDGDFSGDFPFWLVDLLGKARTIGLADRRGECIYSACDHYSRCFIEGAIRRSRKADIVIANHALVMIQAAHGGMDEAYRPTRYVFDEGHHLFETADSAFSANFSGIESTDLRRWLIGAEASNRSRARGLKRRLFDIVAEFTELEAFVDHVTEAARALPAEGWMNRITENTPHGAIETFLSLVRRQVYARSVGNEHAYSLECAMDPPLDGLVPASRDAAAALHSLAKPLLDLIARLKDVLDRHAATLETDKKRKIEATARALQQRGWTTVMAWHSMLGAIGDATPPEFVDWFEIDRMDGRDIDVGFTRHWIDPARPFAQSIAGHAHGVLITSATLTDDSGSVERDWDAAETTSGTRHFPKPAMRAQMASPFDYAARTRIFVVRDVQRNDIDQVAAAYRELFMASGGGALGLFTAIQRLRGVYDRIAPALEDRGIDLYAQHVDGLNPTTLIDIFRSEENSCLLGTDAIRDGVDVPGRALRLIVFDRVPWSRPGILYKAQRDAFGGAAYEDRLTRLRLKQAFGRLIRRADDKGVFVLLDPMLPGRLSSAFPAGVEVIRTGLAETIRQTKDFL